MAGTRESMTSMNDLCLLRLGRGPRRPPTGSGEGVAVASGVHLHSNIGREGGLSGDCPQAAVMTLAVRVG